ncbi:hypothetical protein GCM10010913_25550 [Paenibacillus aceti]|uniref:Uncharacterized protein n=1 Tax=Paenibacillus aceti TaxID=1820010 RepID=A0ABQ1VWD6_9BACL|nr:hypothetical protein GCM10010913_25550 [Paenibacillus aceti]
MKGSGNNIYAFVISSANEEDNTVVGDWLIFEKQQDGYKVRAFNIEVWYRE